jgi:hypothetical protein
VIQEIDTSGTNALNRTGNVLTGDYTLSETNSNSSTTTEYDGNTNQAVNGTQTAAGTETVGSTGNDVTGGYTLSNVSSNFSALDQTGTVGTRTFALSDASTQTRSASKVGNSIVGTNAYTETDTSSDTLYKSDTYGAADSDNQTVFTVGSSTTSGASNDITGAYSLSETSSGGNNTSETGTRSGNSYGINSNDGSTVSASEQGNNVSGVSSSTETTTDTISLTNTGNGATGSYTLAETDQSTATVSSTDNSLTGSYGQTTYSSDTSSVGQVSQNGTASFTVTSNEATAASTTAETGNNISGAYSSSANETDTSTLTQTGTNSGGAYSLTETSTESPTITVSGNSITGDYSMVETGTQGYSFGETNTSGANVYTLSETGSKRHTVTESGSNVTGAYSLTDVGTDIYTLSETGTLGAKTYTQTVTGTDTYTTSETGNQVNAGSGRTVTTSGTDTVTEAGTNNGTGYTTSATSTPGSTIVETDNYLDGVTSLVETGTDRYGLLEQFNNTSNAATGGALPGDLDYSPVGAPFKIGEEPGGLTGGGAYPSGAIGATGSLAAGPDLVAAAHDEAFAQMGMDLLHEYCWRAGTCVFVGDDREAPKTAILKRIEEVQRGEFVLCPSDRDPYGPAAWKRIEEAYHNASAALLELRTHDGHILYPTANHPIFVVEKGWTPAGELQPGDQFVSLGGERARVASVCETGLVEPVYNLRVADNHTYFVSDGDPDFSVLAHNSSIKSLREAHKNSLLNRAWNATTGFVEGLLRSGSKSATEWEAEQSKAAMAERTWAIPKSPDVGLDPRSASQKKRAESAEAGRTAKLSQTPEGREQLQREAEVDSKRARNGVVLRVAVELAATLVPGGGEAGDVATVADPNAPAWQKAAAGASLTANAASGGLLPNVGPVLRAGKALAKGGDKAADAAKTSETVIENAARYADSVRTGSGKIANKVSGDGREAAELADLQAAYPGASIQRERYLRKSDGKIAKDPLTGEGRRVDFGVIENGAVVDMVETTSSTANKSAQIAKENRVREAGGTFIRDRETRSLHDVSDVPTRISRKE